MAVPEVINNKNKNTVNLHNHNFKDIEGGSILGSICLSKDSVPDQKFSGVFFKLSAGSEGIPALDA